MTHRSLLPPAHRSASFAVFAFVSLSCASAPPRVEPTDPAVLTFAWPDGAEAAVRYSVEGWRQEGKTKTTVRRMSSYEMGVRHDPGDGTVVVERRWNRLPGTKNHLGGFRFRSEGALQQLVDDAPEMVAILRISPTGELLAIDGGERIRERLEEVLAEEGTNPVTAVRVRPLFENEGLFLLSTQVWRSLVTAWAGRHLERDFPIVDRSAADVPAAARRVEVQGRGELLGRVPCRAGETEPRCVQLEWRATPEGAATEDAIGFLEARGTSELELSRTITLVVDPSNLLPYSTRDHLVARRVIDRGGEEIEASEEMTRTRDFEWTLP